MSLPTLITDAEMLELSLAIASLNGVAIATRDLHRQAASDLARSMLAPRYAIAKTDDFEASGEVKAAIAAIAAYTLLGYRGFNPANPGDASVKNRHDAAITWFELVRNGNAELAELDFDSGEPLVSGGGESHWENWRNGGSTS